MTTGAASTSRQRGYIPKEVWGERIKIGRDNIQGYQDQGGYEALL